MSSRWGPLLSRWGPLLSRWGPLLSSWGPSLSRRRGVRRQRRCPRIPPESWRGRNGRPPHTPAAPTRPCPGDTAPASSSSRPLPHCTTPGKWGGGSQRGDSRIAGSAAPARLLGGRWVRRRTRARAPPCAPPLFDHQSDHQFDHHFDHQRPPAARDRPRAPERARSPPARSQPPPRRPRPSPALPWRHHGRHAPPTAT